MAQLGSRYERIGHGYARLRREDPRIAERINVALGSARTVVNVGAGAGSYEPRDRHVIAIEPSDVMASQRPGGLPPAIRATAGRLPLRDGSVDAAMAILTIHHWDAEREAGVRELRRVATGPVAILTYVPQVSNEMWLVKDYLPEVGELDVQIFPGTDRLAAWLGGVVRVETLPVHRDSPDWMFGSFWAHPERVLDRDARNATSGFARTPVATVSRVVRALERDLSSGEWDRRHGHLREVDELDVGLRLVVGTPG
jgi:SAM-dependent methyltransferase